MTAAGRRIRTLATLPSRDLEGHKGTFGTTLIVGGATTPMFMPGAPALAGRAALRAGCGRVTLAVPRPLTAGIAAQLPEATMLPLEIDDRVGASGVHEVCEEAMTTAHAVVCGCGWGRPEGLNALLATIVDREDRPRVLDADALNALAVSGRDTLRGPLVLTPHPGEWNRLAGALGVDADALHDERRPLAAALLARRLDAGGGPVVVVLKGARTVVSDGERWWRQEHRNSALATGGSGDVLAGVVGSLLAQFHPRAGARASDTTRGAFELACLGVAMHAAAGRWWSERHGEAGLLAHELADALPAARRLLQSGDD
ncbi:MAG: NAD(P)H-hydrate dehydratase [Planctomycetota bacterium]|nr:NAD(P)H-hydrate dehydratase [Planctomycetota bacterium]